MEEEMDPCQICGTLTPDKELREVKDHGIRKLVCRECFENQIAEDDSE